MSPLRFIFFFIAYYLLGLSMVYFFVFSAHYLQQGNVIFGGLVSSILLTLLFSWLYFRGVPALSWCQRSEVIGVWFGLVFLLDIATLIFVSGGSFSQLSLFSLWSYALQILTLFVAAYLTSGGDHPRLSSPNLALNQNKDAS